MKYFMSRLTTQQKIANARGNGQDSTVYLGNGKGSITYHADGRVTVDKTADTPTGNGSTLNANNSTATVTGSMIRQDIGETSISATATIGSRVINAETNVQNTPNISSMDTTATDVDVVVDLNNGVVKDAVKNTTNIAAGANVQSTTVSNVDVVVDLNTGATTAIGTAAYTDGKVYAEADVNGKLVDYVKLQSTNDTKERMPVSVSDTKLAMTTAKLAMSSVPVLDKNSVVSVNTDESMPIDSMTVVCAAINGEPLLNKSSSEASDTGGSIPSTPIDAMISTRPAINGVPVTSGNTCDVSTYPIDDTKKPNRVNTWLFTANTARSTDTENNTNTCNSAVDTTATNTSNVTTLNQQNEKSADVIAWDTAQIQQHIAKLKAVTTDMENARSSLKALREQVSTNWTSNAATTYLTEMSIDLDDFKVFIDNVDVLDNALNTVLNIFTDCETSVTASMKTLDTQLDTLQSQSTKTAAFGINAVKAV